MCVSTMPACPRRWTLTTIATRDIVASFNTPRRTPDPPTTVARGGSRRARLPDTSRRRETDGSSSATRAAAAAELPTHTAAVEAAVRVLHLASGTPPPRTRRGTASTRAVGIPRLGATSTSWPDDNPSRPPPASTA